MTSMSNCSRARRVRRWPRLRMHGVGARWSTGAAGWRKVGATIPLRITCSTSPGWWMPSMGAELPGTAPLRVLMTTDTVGGVWQYALELSRQLCAEGHEVVLAATGADPSPGQRAEAAAVAGLELHALPGRLEWMSRPWDDIARAGEWLLDLARRFRPDIVHLNDYSQGVLPWPAPVLIVGHSCVLSWWRAVRGGPAPEEWSEYRGRVAAGLRAADLVLAPTAAMLRSLNEHYGPLPATQVIPNGRAPLGRPGSGPREPVVLTAGRLWDAGKNIQ